VGITGRFSRAAFGYEPTREAAMSAVAKSWRRKRKAWNNRSLSSSSLLRTPTAYPWQAKEIKTMRTPSWLRFASSQKSDELNKIRRRTDQMLRHRETQKDQEGEGPEIETAQAN
jgi:hypothetical protein